MAVELYRKYRPTTFGEVIGQEAAVRELAELGKRNEMPHALLFTGPSGTGKTTLARIVRRKLKCSDIDFYEVNSAECRGIDEIRKIKQRIGTAPLAGKCKIWLIDEAHGMTGDAQNAFLKMLEDTPDHVYFMLATTDPHKLKKTIRGRCTPVRCKPIDGRLFKDLVNGVAKKEGTEIDKDVVAKMCIVADGSARKVLVLLHAVIGIDDPVQQMEIIEAEDVKGQAIEIARALLNSNTTWSKMSDILNKVDDEPESIRYMVLSYCRKVMLGGGKSVSRAALIIEEFRENWYYSKLAGLAVSCWNVVASKN